MRHKKAKKKKVSKIGYVQHLNSKEWQIIRRSLIRRRQRCEGCRMTDNLQVHHGSYKHVGDERFNELFLLCSDCHNVLHIEYAEQFPEKELLDFTISFLTERNYKYREDKNTNKVLNRNKKRLKKEQKAGRGTCITYKTVIEKVI
jgi:hypothetical protein